MHESNISPRPGQPCVGTGRGSGVTGHGCSVVLMFSVYTFPLLIVVRCFTVSGSYPGLCHSFNCGQLEEAFGRHH